MTLAEQNIYHACLVCIKKSSTALGPLKHLDPDTTVPPEPPYLRHWLGPLKRFPHFQAVYIVIYIINPYTVAPVNQSVAFNTPASRFAVDAVTSTTVDLRCNIIDIYLKC